MPQHVSSALKDRVPVLYYEQHLSVPKICELLGLRPSTTYRALKFHKKYGLTYNPHTSMAHRRRRLTTSDTYFIRSLLRHDSILYLTEIQDKLQHQQNVDVSLPTIVRTLRQIRYSHKKVAILASERDELRRAAFNLIVCMKKTDLSPELLFSGFFSPCWCWHWGREAGGKTLGQRGHIVQEEVVMDY
jgi:transposase